MRGACQGGTECEKSEVTEHGGAFTSVIWGGKTPGKRETKGAFHEMGESQTTVDSKYGGKECQRREESIIGVIFLEGMWSKELQFKVKEAIKKS